MAQHLRIRGGLASIVGVFALYLTPCATAQNQQPNIPPTRVPLQESGEPNLADPKRAGELPDHLRREILRPMGAAGIAAPGAPVSSDPPTPVISIHVTAPGSVARGSPLEYTITVENKSQAAGHHVKVTNPLTPSLQFNKAEPPPDDHTNSLLTWKLGTLKPGETRTIKLELDFKGDEAEAVENVARVSFEHGQKVKTVLHKPKLSVKKFANQYALEKQAVLCVLEVKNEGALDVDNIVVAETLGEGLEFADGKKGTWQLPKVKAGATEVIKYSVTPTRAGLLNSTVEVSADRGVMAKDFWSVQVGPPPLKVEMTGPDKLYLNYPATYQFKVSNSGTTPLDSVSVSFALAQGMRVERATQGGQASKDHVQWPLGRLDAGKTMTFSITVRSQEARRVPQIVTARWRGPEQRAEVWTEFLGASALHLAVKESKNPVAVGEKIVYSITVQNRGTSPAKSVRLTAQFPIEQFTLLKDESDGKVQLATNDVAIDAFAVPAGGTVTKQVALKATRAGAATFHVEMSSPDLTAGNVIKESSATIVGQ